MFLLSRQRHLLRKLAKFGQAAQSSTNTVIELSVGDKEMTNHPFSPVSPIHKNFLEELRPPLKKSFNLAAYVNKSTTLQTLVKLGVSLYDIENTNNQAGPYYLGLDFEKDCLPYIKFLKDNGLKDSNIGRCISQFPMIFREDLDDLQTRINYFESKGFSKVSIAHAINRSALILSHKTKTIDFKLRQLQIEFRLPAIAIRKIVTAFPEVLQIPEDQFKLANITLTDEFGFKESEVQQLLEIQPNLIEIPRPILIERLDLVHNTMGFSHKTIVKFPKLITGPKLEITHRFEYLKKLNRVQFNPRLPLYVPPTALYKDSTHDFCTKYAKTSIEDYNLFLRSR